MFDERGFSHNTTESARLGQSHQGNDHMKEKDGNIAHLGMLSRSANRLILAFA